MTTDHPMTPEEKAYRRLFEEKKEILSEAARTLLGEAEGEAYKLYLCRNYALNHLEAADDVEGEVPSWRKGHHGGGLR